MKSFIREKKVYCGNYMEVDIFQYTEEQKKATSRGKRSRKVQETPPKQRALNDRNAWRYFIQLTQLNFGGDEKALHTTMTYSPKHIPKTIEDAERKARNFLRRVQYLRNKRGLPPLKYILVTSYTTGKDGETPVRIHHHIIMNGGLDRDEVENLWRERRKKGEKQGERTGYCNADRLQLEYNGIAALCTYLVRQGSGKKRWTSSHNLEKPTSRTNDSKYSRRQVRKWAEERPGRSFWEEKYPGWTLTDGDYGVEYRYNEVTGWAIYLRLFKVKETQSRKRKMKQEAWMFSPMNGR